MKKLTIGELADMAGITTTTLRYYEKHDLLPTAHRTNGGHRFYSQELLPTLHFIQNAKSVGFTLDEVKELLAIKANTKKTSKHVKEVTIKKLKVLEEKILTLQKLYQTLNDLAHQCDGISPVECCPILNSLSQTPNKSITESKKQKPKATATKKTQTKKI